MKIIFSHLHFVPIEILDPISLSRNHIFQVQVDFILQSCSDKFYIIITQNFRIVAL